MKICLNCGRDDENWICNRCKDKVDIEDICYKIIAYSSQDGDNKIFESIIDRTNYYEFKDIVLELAEDLETEKKNALMLDSLTGCKKYYDVSRNRRELFYNIADIFLNSMNISQEDKNYILAALFINNFKDYNYGETEKLAALLKEQDNLDKYVIYELGRYYTFTRRYDIAEIFLEKRISLIDETDTEKTQEIIKKTYNELQKRKNGEMKAYLPAAPENQAKYYEFMNSIGFDEESLASQPIQKKAKGRAKIAPKDYPNIKENEITDFNFDTFVAFDLEVTGFGRKISETATNKRIDDIIEIGAIKVVNGKIDESAKFTFQELVKPMSHKISAEIEQFTGITNEMVHNCEKIWDVFPRFMEFVGDNILVGYNCIQFDCDFLIRAGRYSQIIIKNKFFDIYRNLNKFNIKHCNLNELSKSFNIKNENAHRALSDAITTAKVFMKLKENLADAIITNPTNSISPIKIIGGTNQEADSFEEIWDNLIGDCEESEETIIKKLMKNCTDGLEKPIYSPTVEIISKKQKITVNELWSNAKVMLFLSENKDDYNIAKESGWNCFIIDKNFDIKEFLRSIKN